VLQGACFVLGENDNLPGPFCEALEQVPRPSFPRDPESAVPPAPGRRHS
jgi:hypothetical protein